MQNYQLDLNLKTDETNRLQRTVNDLGQFRERYYELEQQLNSQLKANQVIQEKLMQLQGELLERGGELSLVYKSEHANADRIVDNIRVILQEQLAVRSSSTQKELDEMESKIHDIQLKLTHEKLNNETLEIRYKLVEQDNQNLRKALLTNSKKFNAPERYKFLSKFFLFPDNIKKKFLKIPRMNKSRMEEINELIEKAQKNAQNILSANPGLRNIYELDSQPRAATN